jgi:hypothetical protein
MDFGRHNFDLIPIPRSIFLIKPFKIPFPMLEKGKGQRESWLLFKLIGGKG